MKLKINFMKVISAFILIIVISFAFTGISNSVYGKVNSVYENVGNTATIDLNEATDNSTILAAIGYFVYAIAGFVETVGGKLIKSFTGTEMFPWADRVIFNTIEFLDINFLSPSRGSMFRSIAGEDTIFGNIISSIYYTIFVLAVTFFGVVVGIMALKLAISSIASEKAKYKQAITNWLLALILLFTSHYLISFIFFINEKMVEVASSIFLDQIEQNQENITLDMSFTNDETQLDKLFNVLFECYYEKWDHSEDVFMYRRQDGNTIEELPGDGYIKLVTVRTGDGTFKYKFYTTLNTEDTKDGEKVRYYVDGTRLQDSYDYSLGITGLKQWKYIDARTDTFSPEVHELVDKRFKYYMSVLLCNADYLSRREKLTELTDKIGLVDLGKLMLSVSSVNPVAIIASVKDTFFKDNKFLAEFRLLINDALFILNNDMEVRNAIFGDDAAKSFVDVTAASNYCTQMSRYYPTYNQERKYYYSPISDVLMDVSGSVESVTRGDSEENKVYEIINNLADFFKQAVYVADINPDANVDEGEEIVSRNFQPIVAILYAIFVVQSIMYFIAYMKRFFYIIILALFAPLVIVYDFLTKTTMG